MSLVPTSIGELQCLKIKNKVASQACNACKKRKVKCIGNPCAYCIKKNYICQFNIGKKRGPPKKMRFPKGVQECGSMSAVFLDHIQSSMNVAYRQNNFVDFYFQYIGRPIPAAFKAPLLASSDNELNSDLITQLYIVSAHVMKFFGNTDLEMQCIDKAQRYASNLFTCDTVESAASLLMMAVYVGNKHNKFRTYMKMAFNITDLQSLRTSIDAMKIKYACQAQLILMDDKLSSKQKYEYVVENIFKKAESAMITPHVTKSDWISVLAIKITYMLLVHANFDAQSHTEFIQSLLSPPTIVSEENYAAMMVEVNRMDETLKAMEKGDPKYINSLFNSAHSRFLVEWRAGKTQEALAAAHSSMEIFKENKSLLGLWFHGGFLHLINLPYFYQINGMPDKAQELLTCFEQAAVNTAATEQLRAGWNELCINTGIYTVAQVQDLGLNYSHECSSTEQSPNSSPPSFSPPSPSLSPPQSPETLTISQTILQSFEQSISQHVAQPMSHIISQQQQNDYNYNIPQTFTSTTTTSTPMEQQNNSNVSNDNDNNYNNDVNNTIKQQQQQQQQQQIVFQQILTQTPHFFQQQYEPQPQQLQLINQPSVTYPLQQSNIQSTFNFNMPDANADAQQPLLFFDTDALTDFLFSPVIPELHEM